MFQMNARAKPDYWLDANGKLTDQYRVRVADLEKRERKLYRQNVVPDETQRALTMFGRGRSL